MRKENYLGRARRSVILNWLDVAANLPYHQTFYIPMETQAELNSIRKTTISILEELLTNLGECIYKGIRVRGRTLSGKPHLILSRSRSKEEKPILLSRVERKEKLKLASSSSHNRMRQITLLIKEGYTPEELEEALKPLHPGEEEFINSFKK